MRPSEHAAHQAGRHEGREQREQPAAAAAFAAAVVGHRLRQRFAVDQFHQRRGGVDDAAAVIVGAEFRHQVFLDDAAGGDVRDRALQPVARLDAHVAVVLGHHQQHARRRRPCDPASTGRRRVACTARWSPVACSAPSAPATGCPCVAAGPGPAVRAAASARHPACRWYRPPANPAAGSPPVAGPAAAIPMPARQQQQQGPPDAGRAPGHHRRLSSPLSCSAAVAAAAAAVAAGAAAGWPKSTVGASWIARSFSTVKFGFCL